MSGRLTDRVAKNCAWCHRRMPAGRKTSKCRPCNREYMRAYMRRVRQLRYLDKRLEEMDREMKKFRGVDIDKIHRVWAARKRAA